MKINGEKLDIFINSYVEKKIPLDSQQQKNDIKPLLKKIICNFLDNLSSQFEQRKNTDVCFEASGLCNKMVAEFLDSQLKESGLSYKLDKELLKVYHSTFLCKHLIPGWPEICQSNCKQLKKDREHNFNSHVRRLIIYSNKDMHSDIRKIEPPKPSPENEWQRLQKEGTGNTDWKVVCKDGETLHVQSQILMLSSPYFETLMQSDFKESKEKTIELKEYSKEFLNEYFQFFYTGSLSDSFSDPMDIFNGIQLAKQHQNNEFISACLERIQQILSEGALDQESFQHAFAFCLDCKENDLLTILLAYIQKNNKKEWLAGVVTPENWDDLSEIAKETSNYFLQNELRNIKIYSKNF